MAQEIAKGNVRGPLHGVPLAHKDMYYDAGHVATCGSLIRRDFVPTVTSTALQRLKDAALRVLDDFGGDLDQVLSWPAAKARKALTAFPMIGAPVADRILLFCGAVPTLAPDSNALRVLIRLGVISADVGLALPDYRASERTFQVLTQVAGRAGRGLLGGRVVLQTYNPEHYAIKAASTHNYHEFFARELRYRKELGYERPEPEIPLYIVPGQRNAERYPAYSRLDLTFRRTFKKRWGTLTPYAQVLNATNRKLQIRRAD